MMMQSFCELFTAGCLQVEVRSQQGVPQRSYKIVDGLDLALLSPPEQAVASLLTTFKSFTELLDEAQETLPGARQELLEQSASILEDALAYNPPASSCSV